jgi:hypothetical protein
MKTGVSAIPSTGQVLDFLVKCFGQAKGKGLRIPGSSKSGGRLSEGPAWAQFKRVERLAKHWQQSGRASREVENALIDAVAGIFDASSQKDGLANMIRSMSLGERLKSTRPQIWELNPAFPQFTPRLVFWIVYFVEHHEWLCPQLEAAHPPNEALWQWVQHAFHFYTNKVIDTARSCPFLFASLPGELTWNMPVQHADGSVKWPMAHAVDWLGTLLEPQMTKQLATIMYPNPESAHSSRCFRRLVAGTHLPSLQNAERWARFRWQFRAEAPTADRIRAVLLWCRALQFALKAVEKRFGLNSVWWLFTWHKQAVSPMAIHEARKKVATPHNLRTQRYPC